MPRALMAKLHSWFSVNSRRCCSFMIPCTVSRVISGDMGVLLTGRILPLTLIDGGTPAVMNRSEPPFSTIRRNSFSNSIVVLAVVAKPNRAMPGQVSKPVQDLTAQRRARQKEETLQVKHSEPFQRSKPGTGS